MNDTTPEVAERYRTLIMRRSGSDRLRMACEMFDGARQLMIAGIKADHPDLSDVELRVKIFERTYGSEFAPGERARIAACLRNRGETGAHQPSAADSVGVMSKRERNS